jgi:spore germination cell wall hydrolase CwlJ-like protein
MPFVSSPSLPGDAAALGATSKEPTRMKLAWILWLSQVLPQPAADSLCLSTTVYLEARDQTLPGQQAVAEVALRRRDSGLWGDNLCDVVTARSQFAPAIVSPDTHLYNTEAWAEAVTVALEAGRNWTLPEGERREVVPGASHFFAHNLVSPSWRNAYRVAVIGDHSFLKVQDLPPRG